MFGFPARGLRADCPPLGALVGKTRKCIVLDLDNTLWGGVVGDDGWDGIRLDPNDPVGEAYRFFQKYLLDLKAWGVILVACSKIEQNIAEEPFEKNQNMILKRSDIACFVANWQDKATNLRTIAQALNIGIDSLVFFDDNPAERELVHMNLPEVLVIDVCRTRRIMPRLCRKQTPSTGFRSPRRI